MQQLDIIMFALPRWDQPISSPALSLAKEFAKTGRVFYIEHPYSLKDIFTFRRSESVKARRKYLFFKKAKYYRPSAFPSNLTIVYPSVSIPINFLPEGVFYNFLSSLNDEIIFKAIRQIIKDYKVDNWIYFNSYDPFFARKFPADLMPKYKVYQSMDDISQEDYTAKHGLRLEEEIIRSFDMVLTTSKELTRLKSALNKNTFFHPNAADIILFEQSVFKSLIKPNEISTVKRKIVGFTGSVEYRTDFELLKKLLEQHSDKTFVVVGPVFAGEIQSMGIDKFSNIIFVGAKKISELPAYLQYMDVVIIPYKCNTLTKSIYPLKINEYLGAGKAVVATNFSEDISSFQDVAYISNSHEEFIKMIDLAIEENSDERIIERQRRAAQNTWEVRVQQFWTYLNQVEKSSLKYQGV